MIKDKNDELRRRKSSSTFPDVTFNKVWYTKHIKNKKLCFPENKPWYSILMHISFTNKQNDYLSIIIK